MRTDITNPTWVLSLGVQQRTHESQEPSVSGQLTVQRTNETASFSVMRQNGQNINTECT